jgi:hypothetical protein
MPEQETQELTTEQMQLEAIERERAHDAREPAEERTHERRADRAAYLKEKLHERGAAEERVEREDG